MNSTLSKKISIEGEFYDSYIYKDKLLLIEKSKLVFSYNWRLLVEGLIVHPTDKLAYHCAFLDGKFFYNPSIKVFYKDEDFKALIFSKISRIDNIIINKESELLERCINGKPMSISHFPNDILVYKNIFFYSTNLGVSYKKIRGLGGYRSIHSLSPTTYSLSDKKAVNLAVSNGGYLYLSTLDNGLWLNHLRYSMFDRFRYQDDPVITEEKILDKHSSYVKNAYSSIFIGSYLTDDNFMEIYYEKNIRKTRDTISLDSIFNNEENSFQFAGQDKIYRITSSGLFLVIFTQSKIIIDEGFSEAELVLAHEFDVNSIISASVELFGIIVEYRNKMEIILSDGVIETIDFTSELVNWRTFSRSQNYTNQIHLIFKNRIEIISINHDYFVEQSNKKLGVRYTDLDYLRDRKIDY